MATPSFSLLLLFRTLCGISLLLAFAWLLSENKRKIHWRLIFTGLAAQFLIALSIVYLPPVQFFFNFLGKIFVKIIDFSTEGSRFVFGKLAESDSLGSIFAFQVLPTILFFSALVSLLFYWGILQRIVQALGWLLSKSLRITGQESMVVAGNIFLGQTEAPLLIKPYLNNMSPSGIFLIMTSGMATIAGGVMAAYISFLGGGDPVQRLFFAKHLLAASVMAAPGAIIISRIICPQPGSSAFSFEVSRELRGKNMLDALTMGTETGIRLVATVGATLIVFIALLALINFILFKTGDCLGINSLILSESNGYFNGLSLQFLLSKIFYPVAWMIGVNGNDTSLVGSLLGQKLVLTEFISYVDLARLNQQGIFQEQRSVIISTYLLCGFANFASVGIQVGGIGVLASQHKLTLAKYGMKALLAATITSLISAAMIGIIL